MTTCAHENRYAVRLPYQPTPKSLVFDQLTIICRDCGAKAQNIDELKAMFPKVGAK